MKTIKTLLAFTLMSICFILGLSPPTMAMETPNKKIAVVIVGMGNSGQNQIVKNLSALNFSEIIVIKSEPESEAFDHSPRIDALLIASLRIEKPGIDALLIASLRIEKPDFKPPEKFPTFEGPREDYQKPADVNPFHGFSLVNKARAKIQQTLFFSPLACRNFLQRNSRFITESIA